MATFLWAQDWTYPRGHEQLRGSNPTPRYNFRETWRTLDLENHLLWDNKSLVRINTAKGINPSLRVHSRWLTPTEAKTALRNRPIDRDNFVFVAYRVKRRLGVPTVTLRVWFAPHDTRVWPVWWRIYSATPPTWWSNLHRKPTPEPPTQAPKARSTVYTRALEQDPLEKPINCVGVWPAPRRPTPFGLYGVVVIVPCGTARTGCICPSTKTPTREFALVRPSLKTGSPTS